MVDAITCKDIFVPNTIKDWDDYKVCRRQVKLSRISYTVSEVFKGVLAASLIVGGGLFMAFLTTSTAILLPISISLFALGAAALIASIAFRCLSQRHLKGYTPEKVVEVSSQKLIKLINKFPQKRDDVELARENKHLRKKTNLAVPNDFGIISKYNWFDYPEKLEKNEFSIRSLHLSQDTIVDILEAAFKKDLLVRFHRFPHFAQGMYPPKKNGVDPYKDVCLETDEYAAKFAARILAQDHLVDLKKLNAQLDALRQICRADKKKRCPLVFEIKQHASGVEILLKKRDFQIDIDKYKEIFTDEDLQVVEVDVTVKPD